MDGDDEEEDENSLKTANRVNKTRPGRLRGSPSKKQGKSKWLEDDLEKQTTRTIQLEAYLESQRSKAEMLESELNAEIAAHQALQARTGEMDKVISIEREVYYLNLFPCIRTYMAFSLK